MTMTDLTAVSLFAGIGGFDIALERAGARVVAAVEIDPEARGVLRRQFPQTALFNDVREVTGEQLRAAGFVPGRGVITGGFPCQDLSVAGRRAGLGGARSGLFWQIMRLADELSPRWLILENVPGLLSAVCACPGDDACVDNGRAVRCGQWEKRDGKRVFIPHVPHTPHAGACAGGCMGLHGGAMGTVLGALGKRGYGFAYRVLDAQFFGVPQRRQRVFIAGCLGDRAAPVEVLLEPEGSEGNPAAGRAARAHPAGSAGGHPGVARVAGALTRGSLADYDDNTARAGHLVAHALTAREGKGPDSDAVSGFVFAPEVAGTLGAHGGSGGRTTDLDGHGAYIAATLQGGGRRGHRVDAEGAAGGHLIAFDAAQITHPENRANPKAGDPAPPVAATGQPMIADTLRSHPRPTSNGIGNAVPVALRGREGGSQAELGKPGDPAFTVRTPGGGSSYPMIAHALTSEGADASEDGTGRGTPLVTVDVAATLSAGNAASEGVRQPGRHREDDVNLVAHPVAWRGRGFEMGEEGIANAIRSGGDGHTGDQMGYVMSLAVAGDFSTGEDVAQTVRSAHGQPGNIQAAAAVRRLTPMECERLQGFPDQWTRWQDDGSEQSDSARYRQLGNAVAVPVVEWIARRLVAIEGAAEAEGAA